MFSRMELKNGTKKFNQYYQMRPENKQKDDLFRNDPGLINPNSKLFNPFLFHAAAASFSTADLLQPLVEKNEHQKFTLLKPHHIYSHIGRGEDYGKVVVLDHKNAIAFTVEMSHDSLIHAPHKHQ